MRRNPGPCRCPYPIKCAFAGIVSIKQCILLLYLNDHGSCCLVSRVPAEHLLRRAGSALDRALILSEGHHEATTRRQPSTGPGIARRLRRMVNGRSLMFDRLERRRGRPSGRCRSMLRRFVISNENKNQKDQERCRKASRKCWPKPVPAVSGASRPEPTRTERGKEGGGLGADNTADLARVLPQKRMIPGQEPRRPQLS